MYTNCTHLLHVHHNYLYLSIIKHFEHSCSKRKIFQLAICHGQIRTVLHQIPIYIEIICSCHLKHGISYRLGSDPLKGITESMSHTYWFLAFHSTPAYPLLYLLSFQIHMHFFNYIIYSGLMIFCFQNIYLKSLMH